MRGRFIALEGTDGVGKTALARHLADTDYDDIVPRLSAEPSGARPLVYVPRRQISATSTYAASLMQHLSTILWHSGDAPDLSDAFWVSTQAAWFTAHTETVLQPLLAAGVDVLVDGWLHKFFARLLLQGFTEHELAVIFARVAMPDTVILLLADVGALYDRRRDFRPAEYGMHAGYGGLDQLNRDTFIDYQTRTREALRAFADRDGWPVMEIDPGEAIETTARRIEPILADLRIVSPPTPAPAGNGVTPR
jgi:thymidylate kinase